MSLNEYYDPSEISEEVEGLYMKGKLKKKPY